ncbi:hypothetical protein [Pseudomonas sp. Z3-8]|uniref:hypothetical protein n=1 Tax=Pseudomonas sp. Z3-8 TaxID=2817412 RepID=UPI003DAA1424
MDVERVFERHCIKESILERETVNVSGWLVIIDFGLYVVGENYSEPFESGDKIRLLNSDIAYSVRDTVLPLGGGKSFIFHRVKIVGFFDRGSGCFEVESMMLEDIPGRYVSINLSAEFIALAKAKFPGLMDRSGIDSEDWIDYYL